MEAGDIKFVEYPFAVTSLWERIFYCIYIPMYYSGNKGSKFNRSSKQHHVGMYVEALEAGDTGLYFKEE